MNVLKFILWRTKLMIFNLKYILYTIIQWITGIILLPIVIIEWLSVPLESINIQAKLNRKRYANNKRNLV